MTDIPRILGRRYEIGDLIGRGGMAQVHLGYDTRLSRTVAIKILRTDLAADPMFLARFRREAQSAAALNHPSIVAVYDTGEEEVTTATGAQISLPYIVMEYVKGRTVASLLKSGEPLPISEAVQVVSGVLSALEYSHHEGIIHRDIKPGNVMLTPDGKVKVMDFGIARAIADSAATMTQTNSVVGTAQYLSPEQARGEVVDARSDLYSTGCLLYELLTGKPPFTGDSAVSVAYQHVSEAPTPASQVFSDIPEAVDRVVMKALSKPREMRYQTAAEFRADLLSAIRGDSVTAPELSAATMVVPAAVAATMVAPRPSTVADTSSFAPQPNATSLFPQSGVADDEEEVEEGKRRNRIMIALGVALLLITAAIVAFLVLNRPEEPAPAPTNTATTAPEKVTVPDLTGFDEARAKAELERLGLVYLRGTDKASDTVKKGEFLSSVPAAGAKVASGYTVTVYFSSGPASVTVPNISGRTTDEARTILEDAGLNLGEVKTVNSPNVSKDTVVSTSPEIGETVDKDTKVNINISSGRTEVPDLLKEKVTADEAVKKLNDAGLSVRIIDKSVTDPNLDGFVLSQSASAGDVVEQKTLITIEVGRYQADIKVPPTSDIPSDPNPTNTD